MAKKTTVDFQWANLLLRSECGSTDNLTLAIYRDLLEQEKWSLNKGEQDDYFDGDINEIVQALEYNDVETELINTILQ